MKRWLKAELHTHTSQDPDDGNRITFHSARQLIDHAASLDFDVLAITNHNQMEYDEALAQYGRDRGILLLPGVEATLGGRHVLLYNFSKYRPDWSTPEVVRSKKGAHQLVIAPHPFFPLPSALRRKFFRWIDLFDAVEYSHFYMRRVNFNRRAERVARERGLPLVGTSDLHHLGQLGRTFTYIRAEKTLESVVEAVKRGETRMATRPESASFFVNWLAASTANRSRQALRHFFGGGAPGTGGVQ